MKFRYGVLVHHVATEVVISKGVAAMGALNLRVPVLAFFGHGRAVFESFVIKKIINNIT